MMGVLHLRSLLSLSLSLWFSFIDDGLVSNWINGWEPKKVHITKIKTGTTQMKIYQDIVCMKMKPQFYNQLFFAATRKMSL